MKKLEFEIEAFEQAIKGTELVIDCIQVEGKIGVYYINFDRNNLNYIKVPIEYSGETHCINIYSGESTKNGYWWDGTLDYSDLVRELLIYSNTEFKGGL